MEGCEHGEKGLDGGEERREIERRCREREGARDGKSMKRDGEGRRGRMQDGSQSRTVSGRVRKREACSRWAMHNQPLGVVWAAWSRAAVKMRGWSEGGFVAIVPWHRGRRGGTGSPSPRQASKRAGR